MNNFKNKNIVITGGTSGLGLALTRQLHEMGARLAVIARTAANLAELNRRFPEVVTIAADVSRQEAIYPLAGEIHSRLGEPDVLFNVAGYVGHTPLRLLIDSDCEDLELALQTNLVGPFRLTKALLPSMLLRRQGVVVNISSDAAVQAYPKWGAYAVSKAANDHLTRVFGAELEGQGIHFLSLDPGDMNTPMHFAAVPDANPANLRSPEESAQRILALIAHQDFAPVRRAL